VGPDTPAHVTETDRPLVCSACGAAYKHGFERCPRDGTSLSPNAPDPLIGQVIDARYEIERAISEGAMGRVYLARHSRLSRRFAIKVLFGDLAAQPQMRARFAREAEAASRLEHRNLVSVVDFGESDRGLLYLAMEYIEGRTLDAILREEGTFSEERAVQITRDLCRGLRHLHARGLVHRDLKLENVIVVHDRDVEVPKIVDFGVAWMPVGATKDDRLTREGVVIGTPAFMSPEQAFGDSIDARSDLFSLGVVLYHLLAGRGPFEGNSFEVLQQIVSAPVPSFAARNPDVHVSPELEALVMRLLSKHPAERPATAQALIEALDSLPGRRALPRGVSGLTPLPELEIPLPLPPPIPPPVALAPAPRPRRAWPYGAFAAAVIVAAGIGYAVADRPRQDAAALGDESRLPTLEQAVFDRTLERELDPPRMEDGDGDPEPERRATKKARKKKARKVRAPKIQAAPPPPPPDPLHTLDPKGDASARVTPTPAALAVEHRKVGELIERLTNKRGSPAAATFRLRHMGIPLPATLKNESERIEVARQLASLRRDVQAEIDR
jgi:serine/threonine-protein kinase